MRRTQQVIVRRHVVRAALPHVGPVAVGRVGGATVRMLAALQCVIVPVGIECSLLTHAWGLACRPLDWGSQTENAKGTLA
jgi:hypothetical protein